MHVFSLVFCIYSVWFPFRSSAISYVCMHVGAYVCKCLRVCEWCAEIADVAAVQLLASHPHVFICMYVFIFVRMHALERLKHGPMCNIIVWELFRLKSFMFSYTYIRILMHTNCPCTRNTSPSCLPKKVHIYNIQSGMYTYKHTHARNTKKSTNNTQLSYTEASLFSKW